MVRSIHWTGACDCPKASWKETFMQYESTRRSALVSLGLATIGAAAAATATSTAAAEVKQRSAKGLVPAGAAALADLTARLARVPRRRDFRTVPMVLDDPMLWDHEAL